MHRTAFAVLLVASTLSTAVAHAERRDPRHPRCDVHALAASTDQWLLDAGPRTRKWLVINVGDSGVYLSGSSETTPGHHAHQELVAAGQSAIAEMKYGQPSIQLTGGGGRTTIVVCRFFEP